MPDRVHDGTITYIEVKYITTQDEDKDKSDSFKRYIKGFRNLDSKQYSDSCKIRKSKLI